MCGNNGYYSKFFKITRSIRQGCQISALLFILVAEIIAIKIGKENGKIENVMKGVIIKCQINAVSYFQITGTYKNFEPKNLNPKMVLKTQTFL